MQQGAPKSYHITLSVGRIKDISAVVLECVVFKFYSILSH